MGGEGANRWFRVEFHLNHAADFQAAAFKQGPHGGASMRTMRFHAEPFIRALAARRLDLFELDGLVVVLNDTRNRIDIELQKRHEHACNVSGRRCFSAAAERIGQAAIAR